MAELGEITIDVDVNIRISDETVNRCCHILEMYLKDNPDKIVSSMQGEYPMIWIQDRVTESEGG